MKLNGAHWKSLALNNGLLTKNQCEMPKKLTKVYSTGFPGTTDHGSVCFWPWYPVAVLLQFPAFFQFCNARPRNPMESHGIPKTTNGNDIAALDLLDLSAPRQLLCY